MLSLPFYGPVLDVSAPLHEFLGLSLPFIFALFQALTYLLGGLLLKNVKLWKKLMLGSLVATIAVNTVLLFSPPAIWPWAMAAFGVFSALFILGWTYPFTMHVPMAGRLKLMVSVIIAANIVYISLNILSQITAPTLLLAISGIPLWLTLSMLLLFEPGAELSPPLALPEIKVPFVPIPMLLTFCIFIAGLYLCSGFMYTVMQPYLSTASPYFIHYRYLPYIAALMIMWYFGARLKWYFSIYMGASLLGLAFVSFALAYKIPAGLTMTTILIEAAYAFLDLFIWTTIGDLAFIYGAPFQFFGFALAAMLMSILSGELIGAQLLQIGEHYRLVTALFAAAAVFLTLTVIPWLNERINRDFHRSLNDENGNTEGTPLQKAQALLLPEQDLTPREIEITTLLLKGLTNREIAKQLFISTNTLKTHLKHIYPKFGVTQKRELLSEVLGKKKGLPPPLV